MRIQPLTHEAIPAAVDRLRPAEERSRAIEQTVTEILSAVRSRGDAALVEATRRFDWPQAEATTLRVPEEDLEAAFYAVDEELREAFDVARGNLAWFHMHERRADWDEEGRYGQRLGIRHLPARRAGLYVPGGRGAYSSTVIMNAVPAQVAGVEELFICTPAGRDGRVNESVLAAARFMGISEVYRVGGAQAIAAMAYGTPSVRRADVISGPGNAYVMEAKRQVYGQVGIDGLAGPSEVIVVADEDTQPDWVAADLLAQEEHGSGATGVLVGASEDLCLRVAAATRRLRSERTAAGQERAASPRAELPPAAVLPGEDAGAIPSPGPNDAEAEVTLFAFFPARKEDFLELALAFVNRYAPEHLQLHLGEARAFAQRVTAAGAIFLGSLSPTAYGDYVAGSNHVLPTGGAARFSSPLSVDTFVRKSSLVEMTPSAVRLLAPHLSRLARSEGFDFHRLSGELRGRGPGEPPAEA